MIGQHLGKAVDDVQWRTYLVTHVSDEFRLHLVGSCHVLVGSPQLFVLSYQSLRELSAYQDIAMQQYDGEYK